MTNYNDIFFPFEQEIQKRERKREWIRKHLEYGLKDCNTGFDSDTIAYFTIEDFKILMDRCEALGVGIGGIEPWPNGEYFDVKVAEEYNKDVEDPSWYSIAFQEFIDEGVDHNFSCSYIVTEELINKTRL